MINDEEVEEVFAVLRKKEARMPTNWSLRYKNHSEKLRSGDIYQVAEVVRNFSIRDKDKGLSAGEKRMLSRARQILVSELTFALGSRQGDRGGSPQRGDSLSRSGPVWVVIVAGGKVADSGPRNNSSSWPVARWLHGLWLPPARWPTEWSWWFLRTRCPPEIPSPDLGADRIVAGGTTRAESSRSGLAAVPDEAAIIVVHDAARPLATGKLFSTVVEAVRSGEADGVIPVLPVADTLKRVVESTVEESVDREGLVVVQTPQAFTAGALREAHRTCGEATDDAGLLEGTRRNGPAPCPGSSEPEADPP